MGSLTASSWLPFLLCPESFVAGVVRDRQTHGRPHGSTLTCANSRESILNDTYGIHRVDFPLMQIGCGLQMKDSQINKAAAASGPAELLCPHSAAIMWCMPEWEEDRRPASQERFTAVVCKEGIFFFLGVIKGVTGDQKPAVQSWLCSPSPAVLPLILIQLEKHPLIRCCSIRWLFNLLQSAPAAGRQSE